MKLRASIIVGLTAGLVASHPLEVRAAPIERAGAARKAPTAAPAPASAAQTKVEEGFQALRRGENDAAEAAFKEAARLDPKLPGAYLGLAEVAGRRNDTAQVDSWLQRAMAADPKDTVALRTWATQQYRRGRYPEAETSFKKLIALDPGSAEARADLGELYLVGLKKPKPAEEAYRAAIARDAKYLRAYLGLAGALAAQRRIDDAVAVYRQAEALAPTDPTPPHSLARLYASQAKFDLALAELDKAIKIDPKFLPAHLERGDLLLAKNDIDGAIAAYRAGAATVKEPAILYFRMGVAFQGAQRWSDAENAYLEAVKHEPRMFGAYNNLAFMAASRKERLNDALAWANKAIEISPKTSTLYDTLGWVYRARGELDLAVKALERAIADTPQQPNFRYHLGVVYAEQGKKKEAIAALQKALELDKNFRYAADARARLKELSAKP
jgi:tetratricopeptide (TPR) repeat protein